MIFNYVRETCKVQFILPKSLESKRCHKYVCSFFLGFCCMHWESDVVHHILIVILRFCFPKTIKIKTWIFNWNPMYYIGFQWNIHDFFIFFHKNSQPLLLKWLEPNNNISTMGCHHEGWGQAILIPTTCSRPNVLTNEWAPWQKDIIYKMPHATTILRIFSWLS